VCLENVIYKAVADTLSKQLEPLLQPLFAKLSVADQRPDDDLLTRTEAASLLKVSPVTMALWAHEKRGPEYVRLGNGRGVRYKRSAILAFLESNVGIIGRKGRPPKDRTLVTPATATVRGPR
jgi:hypothetical protein